MADDILIIEEAPTEEEALLEEAIKEAERQREELLESLANSIQSKFTERAAQRVSKENQWIRSAQLYYGKLAYDNYYTKPETPFERPKYKDRPDVNVVRSKCSIAIAQTVSMQFGTGDKNWDLWPAADSLDPEAAIRSEGMSKTIEAQLTDTKYSYQCRKAMWDRVVLGTGILKGPMSVGDLVRGYEQIPGTQTWTPHLTVSHKPKLKRINPWFFYPDETVEEVSKLNDTIEVHPMTAMELKKLMRHPGFMPEEIHRVLESKPDEYASSNWADFALLSENNPNLYKNKYLVMEYHGPVTRDQIDSLGVEPSYHSVDEEYYAEVWVCQGEVIRLELESIEGSFRPPYYVCPWEKDPGSVFGYGVPLMMEDAQRVVNEAWHMILDNSAHSSGPQVAMQKDLIEPANGKWELGPGQIWYLTEAGVGVSEAIQFFNVPNVTENIVPILQMAQGFSEEESQIPLITAGLQSPQPQDTATGQLVMQQASTTLLDFMSEEWDDNITAPIIEAYYSWNMQYNDNPDIKGSFDVDVRTSTQYKNKQLHIRDLEKLSVEAAQNPELSKYINQGELARTRLSMMQLPSRTMIRTPEEVAQIEQEQANQPPDPATMEIMLKARELDLKEMQAEFEINQAQQREAWEYEERMVAAQARLAEAQARVAVSQNDKEIAILELMQRNEEAAARILSQEKIATLNAQTAAFNKALEESRKQVEVQTWNREIDLADRTGSGV